MILGDLEIGARLKLIIGLLSEASTEIEKLYAEVGVKEPEENCYIRALKRLSPDLYHEIVDWKEAEGLPGLAITVRDGRKAIITFSVDLENYHVLVGERL